MADRLASQIERLAPGTPLVRLRPDGTYDGDPAGIDVFLFSVDLAMADDSLAAAGSLLDSASLAWVQGPGAGVEQPIWSELVDRGVRLTSAAGVHAEPIAQYVFTYVLHWHRHVAQHQRQQSEHAWEPIVSDDLTAKTIGVVGYGGIGRATTRVAKAFGMRVMALRRREIRDPDVDASFDPDGLHTLLAQSDYVVLAVPLTESTHQLIDGAALAAMPESSVLINVARGAVVDQAALEAALATRAIRGATLDVTDEEPLPADSALWDLPNCVITPHDAGYSPLAGERLARLFVGNLARYLDGDPLKNEIRPGQL